MSIEGTILDPNRQIGQYERIASAILRESLIHDVPGNDRRMRRSCQMRVLYEKGWPYHDIGKAWGFSGEWVRREILRYHGHISRPNHSNSRKQRPQ
jgi:hypothetical protein